jgi:GNAT superfamily N-acetyltransferase
LRDYGLGVTLRKTAFRVFRIVYEHRDFLIYRIDLRSWNPRLEDCQGLDYRFLEPTDAAPIEQIEAMEEWLQGSIVRRLQEGAVCLAALEDGRVAGFNLVSFGRVWVPLICAFLSFRGRSAWSDQITVDPAYRGRGVAPELRYRMFSELKARGIELFYGGTLKLNSASRKLARKVGFREIVEVRYRKVLMFESRRYTRVKP